MYTYSRQSICFWNR